MSAQEPEIAAQSDSGDGGGKGVTHILVIEDDVDLAELFSFWIADHFGTNIEVHVAHSLEEGERYLQRLHRVQFVILDRHFPEGSGDNLLESITRDFDAITIMITGVAPEIDIIRLPVTDYLVKPVDQETFIKRLSLLEKLQTAHVLDEYANARKASLLEYHLEDPDAHPLFRRFAARWSYDRIEAIDTGDEVLVYELYLGHGETDAERDISVSIVGSFDPELQGAVEAGIIRPVGELVPSGPEYAWIDVQYPEVIEPAENGYVIYEFTTDTPERLIASTIRSDTSSLRTIESRLESTYS